MEVNIIDRIKVLSPNKQLLFGISCVKRMETYLEQYLIETGRSCLVPPISKLIDTIYFNCTLESFSQIRKIVRDVNPGLVEHIIPDTNDDGRNEAVLAQNAAIALAYCLDYIKVNDVNYINYCGQKLIETVDVIMLGIKGENSEIVVSQELNTQRQMLQMIYNMNNDFSTNDLERFKTKIMEFLIG